ncbi:uncharacterized protein LOC129287693 [Prosopis cineraria]|uniref:uncharacterized protein LOC129287693 n=1 Tax=Prosopis cineraria TaxID=364024 RepID=UPI00240F00D8|nr:uncharacterized protein LOC129287693 [Prosopis cineraria]
MELNSANAARRLWNVLRISFLMMRKGVISKRKLIMDMNLMMKKGKLLRKSLSNLMSSHHHYHSKSVTRGGGFGMEYEFSCSNSPNPGFLHLHKRKHHFNLPCINHPQVVDEEETEPEPPKAMVLMPKTPDYAFNLRFDPSDFAAGDRRSPLPSPFSVRISNFSSVDDSEEPGNGLVDDQAEDFIRRFYEQLRMQSRTQLLEYPDVHAQDI